MEEDNNDEAARASGADLQESPPAINASRDPSRGGDEASPNPLPRRQRAHGKGDDRPLFPLESLFWCQPISQDDLGSPDYYNDSNERR